MACSLAVAGAFGPLSPLGGSKLAAAHQRAPLQPACNRVLQKNSDLALAMVDENLQGQRKAKRREVLPYLGILAGAQMLPFSHFTARAQDDGTAAPEKVCENPLGCEIPKKLAPPKRVYKGKRVCEYCKMYLINFNPTPRLGKVRVNTFN